MGIVSLIVNLLPVPILFDYSVDLPRQFVITPMYILATLIVVWIYLTIFENEGGQTLGNLLLNIQVIGAITIQKAAIRNFPKAFILPLVIDVALGRKSNTLRYIDRYTHLRVVCL